MHTTIELSCDKFPTDSHMKKIVDNNKQSLLFWMYYSSKVPTIYGQIDEKNTKIVFQRRPNNGIDEPEVYFTVTDRKGNFKKPLPKYGVYDIFINGELEKSVYIMDSEPINYHQLYTLV